MSDYIDTGADGPSYVLPPIESGPPAETSKLQSRTPNWNLMSAFPESGRSNLLKWPDFKVRFRPIPAIHRIALNCSPAQLSAFE